MRGIVGKVRYGVALGVLGVSATLWVIATAAAVLGVLTATAISSDAVFDQMG